MADSQNWFSEMYYSTSATSVPSNDDELRNWATEHNKIPLKYDSYLNEILFAPNRSFIYFDNNAKSNVVHDSSYIVKFDPYLLTVGKGQHSYDATTRQLTVVRTLLYSNYDGHDEEYYKPIYEKYMWDPILNAPNYHACVGRDYAIRAGFGILKNPYHTEDPVDPNELNIMNDDGWFSFSANASYNRCLLLCTRKKSAASLNIPHIS